MPILHRITDKAKTFFEKLKRRTRNGNGHTGSQDPGKRLTPSTTNNGAGPSLAIADDRTTSGSEVVYTTHSSALGGVNVTRASPPLPSAVAQPTSYPSASPQAVSSNASSQVRLRDPTLDPPAPLFNASPASHVLQYPDESARRSPNPSLLTTPAHGPHPPSAASNYFPNASGFCIGQVNNNVQLASSKTVFECKF